jgi:hypothetical protein
MAFDPSSIGQNLLDRGKDALLETIDSTDLGRALRSANLLPGANPQANRFAEGTWNVEEGYDWRVKLGLPTSGPMKSGEDGLLSPLKATGGMVFPYTPNIYIVNSANYDKISPVHSNYPFPIYQNSSIDSFVIQGEFTAENSSEGEYWIAAVNYLRSITKMAYGNSSEKGTPPPVVKLNGYGDFVFNDVPVIVEQFNVTLGTDVDYIKVDIGANGSWVPTRSEIGVTVFPVYSRDTINKFDLDKFARGDYVLEPKGPGFI